MNKEKLLYDNGLKKTGARLHVLQLFEQSDSALSQPDLEHILNTGVDRVTLYRILSVFEDKGIIHKIIDSNGTGRYALCHNHCNEHHHHDEHLHFNCTVCHKTYCLNDTLIPKILIPKGFKASEIVLSANGICDVCGLKEEALASR